MRIIDLAINDLLQILRDWKAALFLVIMPIGFTLMFGAIFGSSSAGNEEGPADARIPVSFVDQDQGALSAALFDLLSLSDSICPVAPAGEQTLAALQSQVEAGELAAVIVVPAGFSAAFLNAENAPEKRLPLDVTINAQSGAGATAQYALQSVIGRLASAVQAAHFSSQARAQIEPFASDQEQYFAAALSAAVAAWSKPPVTLATSQAVQANAADQVYSDNPYAHASAGMMVQFAIAGLLGAAEVLVLERQSGSLRRLLTTAIARSEILFGHFLAMLAMIFLQFALLIVFAQLVLDVPYFSAPLATLVIALATSIFAASLGLLIGALSKTPEQAVIFSLLPMFILSGLGGAWVPLEFTNPAFQKVAYLSPLAWAMDGIKNIIVRGQGLESMLQPAAILLAFSIAVLAIAAWRFKFEET
jgi:ABC-2 type transport system permease protein